MARLDKGDVRESFRLLRRRRSAELLANQSLMTSPLILPFLLPGDTPDLHVLAVRALLTWAAEQLRPVGPIEWRAPRWRSYCILTYYYLRGDSASALIERFEIKDPTFWKSVRRAIEQVAPIVLAADRDAPHSQRHIAATLRYVTCDDMARRWLRLLSIFPDALPLSAVQTYFPTLDSAVLPTLQRLNAIQVTPQSIHIHSALRAVAKRSLSDAERQAWYTVASKYSVAHQRPLPAILYLLEASRLEAAAQLLLKYQAQLFHDVEKMRAVLQRFDQKNVSAETWSDLCILTGQLAEQSENAETARHAYLRALNSADSFRKATAYFYLAQLARNIDIDAAIHHFERCMVLLSALSTEQAHALHARAAISRAMIFLQTRVDLERAHHDLAIAEKFLHSRPLVALQSALHNGWAIYHQMRCNLAAEEPHRWQAWQLAHEAQNIEQIVNTGHNLALLYLRTGRFERALIYFEDVRVIAESGSLGQMVGLCEKHLGATYFDLGEYEHAREQYVAAHTRFAAMGLKMWQANTCYDLSELFLAMEDSATARRYFEEGQALCAELGLKGAAQLLAALGESWREVTLDLTHRQRKIITYVRRNGAINKEQCRQIHQLSPRQATRVLNELVAVGMLQRIGKARATRYVLVPYTI